MVCVIERMSVTLSMTCAGPRQLLADLDAVGPAGDRLVRPANSFGRVRFHVEHVDVRRTAPLEKEDD